MNFITITCWFLFATMNTYKRRDKSKPSPDAHNCHFRRHTETNNLKLITYI